MATAMVAMAILSGCVLLLYLVCCLLFPLSVSACLHNNRYLYLFLSGCKLICAAIFPFLRISIDSLLVGFKGPLLIAINSMWSKADPDATFSIGTNS